jgi:uncharacterized protein YndB with AHSA1/START domain
MTTDGVLETKDGKKVLRFVRHLAHPIERVWAALTEPDELTAWFAAAEVDLDGGRIVLRWHAKGGPTMDCKITQLEPPTVLEFEGEPHGSLRFELRPDGDGTLLTFTVTADYPDADLASAFAGWHWHLDALATHLGGHRVEWAEEPPSEDWEILRRRYQEKLP